jgi:hypothetical protein
MLTEIIEEAYRLFSNYKTIRPLDICTVCCMTPEAEERLATLPVKLIPCKLLSEYNDGARSEKTRIEEIKHFLPKYLELIGKFEFPSHSTELSFSRLTPFNKFEWTNNELTLLEQFSQEFFELCVSYYPIPSFSDKIDTILIMFWRANFVNILDLLTIWKNNTSKESLLHLRDFVFNGFVQYDQSKLNNPFGDKKLADILRNWLDNEEVKETFAKAIEEMIVEKNELTTTDSNELIMTYEILKTKT